MGLDGIELILRVEETFGIYMTNEEASQIVTVGQMYETVMRKLERPRSEQCLTAKAFYRLRAALTAETGCERRAVRPNTPLDTVVPARKRRRKWPHIARCLHMNLPALQRPRALAAFLTCAILLLIVLGHLGMRHGSFLAGFSLLFGSIVLVLGAVFLTRPFATTVPDCVTVGDVAKALLRDNFRAFSAAADSVNEKEVWDSLVSLIGDELGVRKDDLDAQTRFVQDLNVG